MPVALTSSFPFPTKLDLDFRPDTYVADWCAQAATLQNIAGERRRAEVLRRWNNALRDKAVNRRLVSERLLKDRFAPAEAARWVAGDPLFRVTGEYLPPYLAGELEIARLVLDTRPEIVISVRASATVPLRAIRDQESTPTNSQAALRSLRVVDEQGSTFTHQDTQSAGTFSLRELIRFIDGVRWSRLAEHPEDVPFPEAILLEAVRLNIARSALHDYVKVSSTVYPELKQFYRNRLGWWAKQQGETCSRSRYTRWTWADGLARWWGER